MKNLFKFLVFFLITGLLFSSCEKDTFTEEDAMKALQEVNLAITVTDHSNFDQPIEGATVSTLIDSVAVQKTTDANGMVNFGKIKISGNLNVYVKKTGYTGAFTTVNTQPNDYRQTSITKNIAIYSLSDESLATVKGQLTIETDLTNRTKEVVANAEVRVYNSNLPSGSAKTFIGTTDSLGNYEIKVPVNANGHDQLQVYYNGVEAERTVAVKKNNIYSVKTQKAFYDITNYNPTPIYSIPSAVITIGEPEALGTGFALSTEIDTSSSKLTSMMNYWDIDIIQKGSGYFPNITGNDTTIWVPFSPDTKGLDTACVRLRFEKNGGLLEVSGLRDYNNWDGRYAKYSTKPTIDLSIGGGTGAQIYYNFKLNYNIKISNNGTGYINFPEVKMTSINNGVKSVSDFSYSGGARLIDGSIYAIGGDIITTIGRYDSAPTFEVIDDEHNQAIAYFDYGDINSTDSSLIDSNNWGSYGNNYNSAVPPSVTITSLAGYGSGAEFRAEVNSDGTLNNLELIHKGNGYVKNVNDYKKTGTTSTQWGEGCSLNGSNYTFYNAMPGKTFKKDVYFGTGVVTELEQE